MSVQYADPTVSRCKFDRELVEYRSLGEEYRRRGWFLVHSEFPKALVVLSAPKLKPAAVILGVAFDYTNYDAAPPSVRIVNPFTGERIQVQGADRIRSIALFRHRGYRSRECPAEQKMMVGSVQPYMQAYGPDDIPFLCLAGVREYHEHPAHSGDLWDLHRASGAGRLVRLIDIIYRYGVEPITGFGVQLVPQVGLNYGPVAIVNTLEAITRFVVPTPVVLQTDKQLRAAGRTQSECFVLWSGVQELNSFHII